MDLTKVFGKRSLRDWCRLRWSAGRKCLIQKYTRKGGKSSVLQSNPWILTLKTGRGWISHDRVRTETKGLWRCQNKGGTEEKEAFRGATGEHQKQQRMFDENGSASDAYSDLFRMEFFWRIGVSFKASNWMKKERISSKGKVNSLAGTIRRLDRHNGELHIGSADNRITAAKVTSRYARVHRTKFYRNQSGTTRNFSSIGIELSGLLAGSSGTMVVNVPLTDERLPALWTEGQRVNMWRGGSGVCQYRALNWECEKYFSMENRLQVCSKRATASCLTDSMALILLKSQQDM